MAFKEIFLSDFMPQKITSCRAAPCVTTKSFMKGVFYGAILSCGLWTGIFGFLGKTFF